LKEHVTILGALYIAFGIQGILAGLIVLVSTMGGGLLSGEANVIAITSTVGIAISLLLFVLCVPGVAGGAGILKRRPWARVFVLVLGCLYLPCVPFGTILGIYTIWVLTKPDAIAQFKNETHAA
jgi:hypothetical protein